MKLRMDTGKTYAIALEGGGAKGAYQIGVWRALEENGIKYNAVSGTSVGALNGALMTMRRLDRATEIWENICFSQVMDVDDEEMRRLIHLDLSFGELRGLAGRIGEIIKGRGLDVTPLRRWIAEVVDGRTIRESDVDLYISTYSLTDRKALELRARDLGDEQIDDMLLASAYLPAFRNEKLGGKRYADGGVQDVLPLHSLVEAGYKDIIAIRLYGFGLEKRFRMPKDVKVTTIAPTCDLGGILNFDAEQSRYDLELGYLDGMRALYGLRGTDYYIDRTMNEEEAYVLLREYGSHMHASEGDRVSLRVLNEKVLPKLAKELDVKGDYYDVLTVCLEKLAAALYVPRLRIMTDRELIDETLAAMRERGVGGDEAVELLAPRRLAPLKLI